MIFSGCRHLVPAAVQIKRVWNNTMRSAIWDVFFPPNRALAQCFHVASDSIEKHCPVIFWASFCLWKCKNTSAISFASLLLLKLETKKKKMTKFHPIRQSGSFFGSEMWFMSVPEWSSVLFSIIITDRLKEKREEAIAEAQERNREEPVVETSVRNREEPVAGLNHFLCKNN